MRNDQKVCVKYVMKFTLCAFLISFSSTEMASGICTRLIDTAWRSYGSDLKNVPQAEGIYTIGVRRANGTVRYLYVGHSVNIHRRLLEHRRGDLKIDMFIKKQLAKNKGKCLKAKWVKARKSKRKEDAYIICMEEKRGYKLEYNIKRGNGT